MFKIIRLELYIMPKKSSNPTGIIILSILLLLTIGGFGFWNYTLQVNKVTTYYAEHATAFTTDSEDSFQAIPDLSISIDVNKGDKVYIMFTCTASIVATSAYTRMHFIVRINTELIYASQVSVGYTGVSPVSPNVYSVALQYLDATLTAGSYTLTILTERESDGNIINSNLLVQVY